ncbi:gibberellin 3-beta-dioxygenase 1-like [Rhodamnia argentea]|uniref:Gibberellin 3-beta-dioxygenase 1-like n=1 Tax=Rhodamnia argentea TaxID=178133 RepID=A0ABM3HB87_9MYRT|nr:gibberellin 3-beta-dioxygenase 1-like [Rhodamnia argentea]
MATLSEAYTETPLLLEHIIPIDFDSFKEVPQSHSWPRSGDESPRRMLNFEGDHFSVPAIDLESPDAIEMVGHACKNLGIFQVTRHGIPSSLLREVESQAWQFFSLPARAKVRAARSPGGATGYGVARITPFFNKFMWHEGFTMMGSPLEHAREVWPHGYRKFCKVMEDYQDKMKALSERLLAMILKYLGISEHDIDWPRLRSNPSSALQLNSYPQCPDPGLAMGLAPHTDTSFLTILHQNDSAHGLQFHREGRGWVPVLPMDGALVVNVGDMLHIMSNAMFPSVVHRVIANGKRHRLSIGYFYRPPMDFRIGPIHGLTQASGQEVAARFQSIMVKDYVQMKAKNLDKALSMIRIG